MKIELVKQEDWSPKHPEKCNCMRCEVVRTRGLDVLMGLVCGITEDAREEAVATTRHADPFDVEVPAIAILEDHGAALARQHLFA